mmetsp:Transcript_4949/g.8725  ORF Transcript_4949/g.8725 Transcript_4949/m.8725 type:complete len:208 (-) Transcript_4949:57-680(-)
MGFHLKILSALCIYALISLWGIPFAKSDDILEFEDEKHAVLLFSKTSEDDYVVEGMNYTVIYSIQNIGDAEAVNVKTADLYDENSFEVVVGDPNMEIESIEAGGLQRFAVTVVPRAAGVLRMPRAALQYRTRGQEAADDATQVGYSSTLGQVEIITLEAFMKATSIYVQEWLSFGISFAILIGAPFVMYTLLKRSNEILYASKTKRA